MNGCHFVLMSYYLRVRFKNNVQRPRHMEPKKIARIEHYFKLQIPADKAFLGYSKLYPEESIGKSTFFKYYTKLRRGEPVYGWLMRNDSIDEERLHQLSSPIHLWPPGSWPRNWAVLFLQLPSGSGRCTSSTSGRFSANNTNIGNFIRAFKVSRANSVLQGKGRPVRSRRSP